MLEHGVSHLAIFDVDQSQASAACTHLLSLHRDNKPEVLFRALDVTDEAVVNSTIDEVAAAFGGIDLLVCFAGITGSELSVEYDIQRWRNIFDVNLHGSFLVARSVAKYKSSSHGIGVILIVYQADDCQRDRRVHYLYGFHVRLRRQHPATAPGLCSFKSCCAPSRSLFSRRMGWPQNSREFDIARHYEHPSIRRSRTGRLEKAVAGEVAHGHWRSRRPYRCCHLIVQRGR